MYKLSKRSLDRLKGIEPLLIAIATDSIRESPFDFGIPENGGFRTAQQQKILFDKGYSKADGYLKKSYHQTGLAFDIYVKGNDTDVLEAIARHIQKIAAERYNTPITWGGDWNNNNIRDDKEAKKTFFDAYHFQINRNQLIY